MHFLIVELKLHGDAAVTDGFQARLFQNGSNSTDLDGEAPRWAVCTGVSGEVS